MTAEAFWLTVVAALIAGLATAAIAAAVRAAVRRKRTPRVSLHLERLSTYEGGLAVVLVASNKGPHLARNVRYQVEALERLKVRRNVDVSPDPTVEERFGRRWVLFGMPRDQVPPDVPPGRASLGVYLIDGEIRPRDQLHVTAWIENGTTTTAALRLDRALVDYSDT